MGPCAKAFFSLISYSLKYRVVDSSNPLSLQMAVLSIFLFSYDCKPVYYCMSVSHFSNILLNAASKHNLCPCVLSPFRHVQLFVTPWTITHQASLSMEFSRQEYWSGLPFPSLGISPIQGLNPHLLWLLHSRQILYTELCPTGSSITYKHFIFQPLLELWAL